jgi:hypothetical protein
MTSAALAHAIFVEVLTITGSVALLLVRTYLLVARVLLYTATFAYSHTQLFTSFVSIRGPELICLRFCDLFVQHLRNFIEHIFNLRVDKKHTPQVTVRKFSVTGSKSYFSSKKFLKASHYFLKTAKKHHEIKILSP